MADILYQGRASRIGRARSLTSTAPESLAPLLPDVPQGEERECKETYLANTSVRVLDPLPPAYQRAVKFQARRTVSASPVLPLLPRPAMPEAVSSANSKKDELCKEKRRIQKAECGEYAGRTINPRTRSVQDARILLARRLARAATQERQEEDCKEPDQVRQDPSATVPLNAHGILV